MSGVCGGWCRGVWAGSGWHTNLFASAGLVEQFSRARDLPFRQALGPTEVLEGLGLDEAVVSVGPVVDKGFLQGDGRVGDDADVAEEIFGGRMQHEGVQEINVAHLARGLVEGLVATELGVLDPRVPQPASFRVGFRDVGGASFAEVGGSALREVVLLR